ncbi:MAG: tRNA (N6-isopentenyl adenosine(37)-C2)-methylthiotransferase MiaB [Ruminococcus sp.]|nr:tRNA (N6-isopentenyl adenosine(37)-C2)-methylthiotransferase MiaB [Ruminococcus sp.]
MYIGYLVPYDDFKEGAISLSYQENADSRSGIRQYCDNYFEQNGHRPLALIHSYGCQQNVSDGEKLKGQLMLAGYEFTEDAEQAQLIILNTCAVRENAENTVYGAVGDLKHLKEKNPDLIIGICGCMAQLEQVAKKVKTSYRQVDLVFGTFAYNRLYDMLYSVISKKERVFDTTETPGELNEDYVQLRSSRIKAFVPIMYGCNNFCTYCIVPYVRGRERSRKPQAVIEEVRKLVGEGYKEITLLGQNVNSYSYGFVDLLKEIDKIEGEYWIRFMSSHPKDASFELIDTIIEGEHIAKHLHLPVQAGSDRILKAMNRRYTTNDYLKIIDYAREKMPGFSFTTDLIVGFPGETEQEFQMTKDIIKRVGYDNIYSFVYSKRSGTPAANMPDDTDDKTKGLRLRELLLEQRENIEKLFSRFIGKEITVLCEDKGRQLSLTGKNTENIIVEFDGDERLIGSFVRVKITKAANWALFGELIKER